MPIFTPYQIDYFPRATGVYITVSHILKKNLVSRLKPLQFTLDNEPFQLDIRHLYWKNTERKRTCWKRFWRQAKIKATKWGVCRQENDSFNHLFNHSQQRKSRGKIAEEKSLTYS